MFDPTHDDSDVPERSKQKHPDQNITKPTGKTATGKKKFLTGRNKKPTIKKQDDFGSSRKEKAMPNTTHTAVGHGAGTSASAAYSHSDKRGRRSEVRPDINLTALAEEIGVGPAYLSKVFRGIGTPSLQTAERLASAMGITLDQLYQELAEAREKREQKLAKKRAGKAKKRKA